jgi:hypothetical protein
MAASKCALVDKTNPDLNINFLPITKYEFKKREYLPNIDY